MSDAEEFDFELVTSARMLAAPPPLRNEVVTLEGWKTVSGKSARFMVWELTAADYAAFLESGRVYGKDGQFKRYDQEGENLRYLAYTLRDQHGNRLWSKVDDAKPLLGKLGRGHVEQLMLAGQKLNSPKDEAKEGNSEETESDS